MSSTKRKLDDLFISSEKPELPSKEKSSTRLRVRELLRERRWTTKVLAEKTGMSESYLTHIKNSTRRWNEDALRKISDAFELEPIELFAYRTKRTDNLDSLVDADSSAEYATDSLRMKLVPVMGEIPATPSPYINQQMQLETGFADSFVAVFNSDDPNIFCYSVPNNDMAPRFSKGDLLIISPEIWTKSGDIVAVEYVVDGIKKLKIMLVSYMDDFVVLESVNHKEAPFALVKGKDTFKIIGKVVWKYQKL